MKASFKEVQRVDSLWPLLLLAITLVSNWVLYFKMQENNWDYFYISVSTAMLISGLLVMTRLTTHIDSRGISFRLFPFQWKEKTLLWQDIELAQVRTYKPIQDFGGWGLRWSRNGRSYSVKGNNGIQLVLRNQKRILVGTQKSEIVEEMITQYKK